MIRNLALVALGAFLGYAAVRIKRVYDLVALVRAFGSQ